MMTHDSPYHIDTLSKFLLNPNCRQHVLLEGTKAAIFQDRQGGLASLQGTVQYSAVPDCIVPYRKLYETPLLEHHESAKKVRSVGKEISQIMLRYLLEFSSISK